MTGQERDWSFENDASNGSHELSSTVKIKQMKIPHKKTYLTPKKNHVLQLRLRLTVVILSYKTLNHLFKRKTW